MTLASWNYNPGGMNVAVLGDMDYTELEGSGDESYSAGASSANRILACQWDNRATFLDALLGYSLQSGSVMNRVLPDAHPDIMNFSAENATIKGRGILGASDNGAASYNCAIVQVNYMPLPYYVAADDDISLELERYVERCPEFHGESLTVQGAMKFSSSGVVIQTQPSIIVSANEWVYKWHEVAGLNANPFICPNITAYRACVGKINSSSFDVSCLNFPVGTALFLGQTAKLVTPKLSDTSDTSGFGNYFWEIEMRFLEKTTGHNYVYDISTGSYDQLVSTVSGQPLYSSADLNSLFTLG